MSASVFKPITLEIPRIRSPVTDRRFLTKGLARVKRALFDPIDQAESQKFLDAELNKHSISCSKKWEFDFFNEQPLNVGKTGRYVWSPMANVRRPEVPRKKPEVEIEDNSELYPQPSEIVFPVIEVESSEIVFPVIEVEEMEKIVEKPRGECKKQCLITGELIQIKQLFLIYILWVNKFK